MNRAPKLKKLLGEYDSQLFWSTLVLIFLIVVWGLFDPEQFNVAMKVSQGWVTNTFSWFFLLTVAALIGTSVWLAISRCGDIPLGDDNEKPEYPFYSWIAMLFSCGIGVGFYFWGVAEPLFHYMSPPYMAEGNTPDAVVVAMQVSLLHWGIHGWAVYTVSGLAIAYTTYRLKQPLSIAHSLYGILGERVNGGWGKVVDFFAAVATIAGIAASLGAGLTSIRYGINQVFGLDMGDTGLLFVAFGIIVAYTVSAISGIQRGIKWLSNINISLAFLVLLFFLFTGPTTFLIELLTESIGGYFQNLIFMTFWADAQDQAEGGKWLGWWTVFYWCWWISWGPFVGGFVARISKGRTIREFVFGVLLVPLGITVIWFSVVGGSALHAEIFGTLELYKAISADTSAGIFELLKTYPMGSFVSFVVLFNLIIFLVTSCDSAAFFVGMIVSGGKLEPSTPLKLVFGFLIGSVTLVLFFTGGWRALQTATIIAALPFAFVMIGMIFSVYYLISKEVHK